MKREFREIFREKIEMKHKEVCEKRDVKRLIKIVRGVS